LELAREQIARLQPEVEQFTEQQQTAVRRQMQRAEQLAATNLPAAQKIWQGIITLYGDKSWAKEWVGKAQAHLSQHSSESERDVATPQ
jgi:hypothetical protein